LVGLTEAFVLRRGRVDAEAWSAADPARLRTGADLLRDRSHTLEDLAWAMEMLFEGSLDRVDDIDVTEAQRELMAHVADAVERVSPFTAEGVETAVRETLAAHEAKLKDVALASRIAVTGRRAGPGLFDILSAVGPETTAERLRTYAGGESS